MEFIDKKKLIDLGFKENQAVTIIRMAKHNLANNGYAYYNNKRLGVDAIICNRRNIGIFL